MKFENIFKNLMQENEIPPQASMDLNANGLDTTINSTGENPDAKPQYIEGGLADNMTKEDIATKLGITIEELEAAIAEGVQIESEHSNDLAIQESIVCDHLLEFGVAYYPALKKMEEKLKPTDNKEDEGEDEDEKDDKKEKKDKKEKPKAKKAEKKDKDEDKDDEKEEKDEKPEKKDKKDKEDKE